VSWERPPRCCPKIPDTAVGPAEPKRWLKIPARCRPFELRNNVLSISGNGGVSLDRNASTNALARCERGAARETRSKSCGAFLMFAVAGSAYSSRGPMRFESDISSACGTTSLLRDPIALVCPCCCTSRTQLDRVTLLVPCQFLFQPRIEPHLSSCSRRFADTARSPTESRPPSVPGRWPHYLSHWSEKLPRTNHPSCNPG